LDILRSQPIQINSSVYYKSQENNTAQKKQNPRQAIKSTVYTLRLGTGEINLKCEKEIRHIYIKY